MHTLNLSKLLKEHAKDDTAHQKLLQVFEDYLAHMAQYEAIFEKSFDAIIIFNDAGDCMNVNAAACELFGCEQDQLTQKNIQHLIIRSDKTDQTPIDFTIANKVGTCAIKHKNNRDRLVEYSFIQHIHPNQNVLILKDITERERTTNALERSEHRAQVMLRAIPDMLFHLNSDGTYLDAYANEEDILADSIKSLIGGNIHDYFSGDLLTLIQQKILATLTTGQTAPFEYTISDKHGALRDYEARLFKVDHNEIIAVVKDITEQKRIQDENIQFHLEKEKYDLLRLFVQSASHEFRTPLTILKSNIYLMMRLKEQEKRQEKANKAEHAIQRITNLLDSLLLITELEKQRYTTFTEIHINSVLHEAVTTIQAQYANAPQINLQLDDKLPPIIGNHEYLPSAFEYVIDNAFRFTSPDGSITIESGHTDLMVWVAIEDTGIGIAKENMSKIFKLFWRQDKTHSTPGLGLGLSIAEKILAYHMGTITVKSVLSKGTVVQITLPRHQPPEIPIAPLEY